MPLQTSSQTIVVTEDMTASKVGSGLLPVFATPQACALMENTACLCLNDMADDSTTVGTRIDIRHLKASATGETLTCTATLVRQEDRLYGFQIEITNARNEVVATATHERVRVSKERFMQRVNEARN